MSRNPNQAISELLKKIATAYAESGAWPAVTTTAEAEADLVAGLRRWRQSGGGWQGDRLANPRWYNLLLDSWEAASHSAACVAEHLAEFRELTKPQEEQA